MVCETSLLINTLPLLCAMSIQELGYHDSPHLPTFVTLSNACPLTISHGSVILFTQVSNVGYSVPLRQSSPHYA